MNIIFIYILNKRFANQFEVISTDEHSYVKFPAKNLEFGDVIIYEEEPGSYLIVLGKFTHTHVDGCDETGDEFYGFATGDIFDFLEDIFADQIVCRGSHEGGGGFRWVEDWRPTGYDDYFVWSGKYKQAALIDFEDWLKESQNKWKRCNIDTTEITYQSPSDSPAYIVRIEQNTVYAMGEIKMRIGSGESGNLYMMDFEALNTNNEHYYCHYEFLHDYNYDEWQNEYVSFMCGL